MSSPSALQKLQELSTIVPDTADLARVRQLGATDVDLCASRINAAAQMPEHDDVVDATIAWAQRQVGKGGNRKLVAIRAVERLPLAFGLRMLAIVPGRVSVELDARQAYETASLVESALKLSEQFAEGGAEPDRVLVKTPATWEGIRAARKLEKKGVHCAMTLVFGLHQLAASADAGATAVAPAVGRISDWHRKKAGVERFEPTDDPGVQAAAQMYAYLRAHGYDTALMPGTFRGEDQALALAGCDYLVLPPRLLELLEADHGEVERRLGPELGAEAAPAKLELDKAGFAKMHADDALATRKLAGGVKNLIWARVSQQTQLVDWIECRQDRAAHASAIALFKVWDYDNNGRLSLEEMAVGLGAPCRPPEDEG